MSEPKNNIDWAHMVNSLKEENQKLTEQLESYESGLKGACSTCEPVGMLNKELTEQLERLTECSYPEWCEPRSKKYKCQGCKNKALLEVEG